MSDYRQSRTTIVRKFCRGYNSHQFVAPSILLLHRSIWEKSPRAREWKNALAVRAGLFRIEIMATRGWKREEANEWEKDGEEASEREGRKRAKETELQRKIIRKGGRGRETERREHARIRALKTTQRAHATTTNEWMSEWISERESECECVCVSVYVCKRERKREEEREMCVSWEKVGDQDVVRVWVCEWVDERDRVTACARVCV